jgi:hypothetical protein
MTGLDTVGGLKRGSTSDLGGGVGGTGRRRLDGDVRGSPSPLWALAGVAW